MYCLKLEEEDDDGDKEEEKNPKYLYGWNMFVYFLTAIKWRIQNIIAEQIRPLNRSIFCS
jgi:hypothetical protein